MTRESRSRFRARELGERLQAPFGAEEFSPVGGSGSIVLDLDSTSPSEAKIWREALCEQLPTLPCVTIAVLGEASTDSLRALASSCDVAMSRNEDCEAFVANFASTPIAALSFVQLLRLAQTRSAYAGLVAESFVYSTLQSGSEFQCWLKTLPKKKRVMSTESGPACQLEREGERLTMTLNRPLAHNAFSREMRDAVVEGLHFVLADSSIEEVLLCGAGESFCAGGDLREFGSFSDPAEAHAIRITRSPAFLISRVGDRLTSNLHGACIGAGLELPAFSNRVIASESAFFQLPEISMGLVPGAGGSVSLPRRIGRQRTAWLGLSGQRIDAQTALVWGLVDEVRLNTPSMKA